MRCAECGTWLPDGEDCASRFHVLLAAEWDHPEAAEMHGLFVLVYHAQHPSLCKPWVRASHREYLREIFGEGRPWREAMSWPKDRRLRQEAVDQAKKRFADAPDAPAPGSPVPGERTIADLPTPGDTNYPSEYPTEVERWAKSVAESRFL